MVIIDFSPVIREGLSVILGKDHTLEVLGDATDAQAALLLMNQASADGRPVDVVLTEARTVSLDGIAATRLIKESFPDAAVLMLTENQNERHVIEAIHAGAGGFILLKEMSPSVLLNSIHRVVEGGMQMEVTLLRDAVNTLRQNSCRNGRKTLVRRAIEAAHLTTRETEVLRLMGNGEPNQAIGEALEITLVTARKHVRNVTEKLQARSRTHAATIGALAGLALL